MNQDKLLSRRKGQPTFKIGALYPRTENMSFEKHTLWAYTKVVGYRLNHFGKPVFMAVPKPFLTKISIQQ